MKKEPVLFYGLAACLLAGATLLFLTYRIIPVGRDAGYYIPMAAEVMRGGIPAVDLDTWYTPFVYYVYAFWMGLFGSAAEGLSLLLYLVHALNAVLLFFASARFLEGPAARAVVSLCYFCAVIVCEGYCITLEPFQVTFAVLAFHFYTLDARIPTRYALAGLCLGISIMFKQYSVLVLAGFSLAVAFDLVSRRKAGAAPQKELLGFAAMLAASGVPFVAYVFFSNASFTHALFSFGFVGNRAVSYFLDDSYGLAERMKNVYDNVTYLYWLFIPPLAYFLLGPRRKDMPGFTPIVMWGLVFSATPIAVRWYKHYFQLVAPWSFLMASALLALALRQPFAHGRSGRDLAWVAGVSLIVLLPLCVLIKPSFWKFSFFGIYRMAALGLFVLWALRYRLYADMKAWIPAVLVLMVSECLLCGRDIPFDELRKEKERQLVVAAKVADVVEKGSEVMIVDVPSLFVLGGYRDPVRDYGFITLGNAQEKLTHERLAKTGRIIIKEDDPLAVSGFFDARGFVRAGPIDETGLVFYKRRSPLEQGGHTAVGP